MGKRVEQPASLVKRIIALGIDMILIALFVSSPFMAFYYADVGASADTFSDLKGAVPFEVSFIMSLLVISYFVILEKYQGQTIGKIITKIYVVSDTKQQSYWQYVLRSIWFLPFPFALFWWIDSFYYLFAKKNVRLTEQWSNTRVVEYNEK